MTARDGKPCRQCGTSEWYIGRGCKKCTRDRNRTQEARATKDAYRKTAKGMSITNASRNRYIRGKGSIKTKVSQLKRRIKSIEGGDIYTAMEWSALCNHYENKCLRCGKSGVKLTADHVVSLTNGGKNSIDNIQPLCQPCNSSKGSMNTDYRGNVAKFDIWRQGEFSF